MTDNSVDSRPTGRSLLIVMIAAMAALMEGLDATIIMTALPNMAASFNASAVAMSVGLTAYLLTVAIVTPASGWLADRFGARNVFAVSIAVFTAASVLCGLSDNLTTFTGARVIQAIGGALMTSVGRLIVFRMTPKSQLVRAINWMTVPTLLGPAIGPPLGGFLATHVGWRAGFFINVPIGLLGLILVLTVFPKSKAEPRPFDLPGFALSGCALASLIYGMQLLSGESGGDLQLGVILALASVPLLWLAWRHAERAAAPLIPLTPLRIPTFRVGAFTAGSLPRIVLFATGLFMPLMFQVSLGMTAQASGLLVLSHMIGDLAAKAFTTQAVRRMGFRSLLIWSVAVYAAGMIAFIWVGQGTPIWVLVALLLVTGAARSFHMSALAALQFADVPQSEISAASTFAAVTLQAVRAGAIALAAVTLNLIAMTQGRSSEHLVLGDFHIAFVLSGLLAGAAYLSYRRLPPDAGSTVSGHVGRRG